MGTRAIFWLCGWLSNLNTIFNKDIEEKFGFWIKNV
jgi:hypothetical protein